MTVRNFLSQIILVTLFTSGAHAEDGHEYEPLQEHTVNYKNWTLNDLKDNKPVELRALMKGKKLVMVLYFAPWCGNCKFEAPVAARLYEKYKDRSFEIIGVSEYSTRDEVKKFFGSAGAPYPVVTESETSDAREKTAHFGYRKLTGDKRGWGVPWNIFLDPAACAKGGEVLTEKAWVVNGELIEADADKFIGERLKSATPAPYPPSAVIASIAWAPRSEIVHRAKGSDNWPLTWGDDDALYSAYGDGNGFEPFVPKKLSMGLAKVLGGPTDLNGVNLRSESAETLGDGKAGRKASGILMVDGVLYLLVRNAGNAQLGWSRDHGAAWTWADWKFIASFGCPGFVNFGKNYAGARDGYVYIHSLDKDNAYDAADRMVLARVPKEKLTERDAYEFFGGVSAAGASQWTKDIAARGAVFENPGKCYRGGMTYNAALKRYLWCQILPASTHPQGPRFQGGFGIYDAPAPWGPWTTVYYTEEWDVGPGESSSFPTKWMSADGKTMYLVFSSEDTFAVRKATLTVKE